MALLVQYSDEQLISLIRKNNKKAFNELFNRYWDSLYAAVFKRLQSREDTEELLQDLFASLWLNREKWVIRTSVAAYLSSSAKYMCIRALRNKAMKTRVLRGIKAHEHDHATSDAVALHDLQDALKKEMGNLPDKCRKVFEMSRYENRSVKEIASHLDISEKTVENHIGKALKILRVHLKDYLAFIFFLFQ